MIFYYATLLLIPFYAHPLISSNIAGITPIKAAGAGAFVCALMQGFATTNRFQQRPKSLTVFGLLVAIFCLGIVFHFSELHGTALLRFASILLFALTTLALVNTQQRLLASWVAIIVGMNIASAYMVRQYLQYSAQYEGFRPGGIFGDPNYYAASAVAAIPMAWALRKRVNGRLVSAFGLASTAALLVGLAISRSRGGFIGLAAVLVWSAYYSTPRVRLAVAFSTICIAFIVFSPVEILDRLQGTGTATRSSFDRRLQLLHSGMDVVRERPWLGVGMGNFKGYRPANHDVPIDGIAHNSYLELAAENGIPALVLFLLFCLFSIRDTIRAQSIHGHDSQISDLLLGMRLGLIGFLISAVFLSAQYERMFWVTCFLTMACFRIPSPDVADECQELCDDEERGDAPWLQHHPHNSSQRPRDGLLST